MPAKSEIRKDAVFPRLEESPAWTIYLDDTTIIEKVGRTVARKLEGLPAMEQAQLRTVEGVNQAPDICRKSGPHLAVPPVSVFSIARNFPGHSPEPRGGEGKHSDAGVRESAPGGGLGSEG